MRIQEVAHGDDMASLLMDGAVTEHLLRLRFTRILLAQVLDMRVDAGAGQLLGERDLLQGELVDGSACGAEQRGGCEDSGLHDG